MNNSQVSHVWAQGNGATAKGSNFRCEDNALYSYSTMIGYILDGQIYLSADNMTPTTGKQLSYARHACSYNYFATPFFKYGHGPGRYEDSPTHENLITPAAEAHIEAFKALLRKRKPDVDGYQARRREIIDLALRFNVVIPEIPEAGGDLKEKAKAFQAQERERARIEKERREERERAQRIIDQGQLDLWLQTGQGRFPYSFMVRGKDRITIRGETVVTSQGAECPLDHVVKALKFYDSRVATHRYICTACGHVSYHKDCTDDKLNCGACRARAFGLQRDEWCYGEGIYLPYKTNGHKIHLGHFTLDEILENGDVKAGCHYFTAAEIARFRKQWNI